MPTGEIRLIAVIARDVRNRESRTNGICRNARKGRNRTMGIIEAIYGKELSLLHVQGALQSTG